MPTYTVVESIATGNPPLRKSQEFAAGFMGRVEGMSEPLKKRIPLIYERSGIDFRYSCIEDYGREPQDFDFFPKSWSLKPAPSTARRNQKYRESIIPLAERVAADALLQAGVGPQEVTHVVVASCTGFFAPGLDIELVKRLGLPASTQRTFVGFMGCYAAFNALRVAHAFCQARSDARVLVVCAELCTLHFQVEDTMESAVVNAIFSDGAAAAVLAARSETEAEGKLAYADTHAVLDDDSMGDMTWELGDTGFMMGLSSRVPSVIAKNLPAYLDTLLSGNDLDLGDVDFWAIHPGGRAIVEKARDVLGLPSSAVHDSLEVLRLHGNMSSPTILFVLKRFLDRHRQSGYNGHVGLKNGVALAFGPGLTLEGALLRRAPFYVSAESIGPSRSALALE
ncbi:MAG TPA: type III polyketide synthase [Rhodothermales bacterium]|nr:type III polyketide synthase [Rhodothermales bacterium]